MYIYIQIHKTYKMYVKKKNKNTSGGTNELVQFTSTDREIGCLPCTRLTQPRFNSQHSHNDP